MDSEFSILEEYDAGWDEILHKPKVDLLCAVCGTPFAARVGKGARFCSKACADVGKKKPDKKCVICGAMFKYKKRTSTCSRTCGAQWRWQLRGGALTVEKCRGCGEDFKPRQKRNTKQMFCTAACRAAYNRVECKCQRCGKTFYKKRDSIERAGKAGHVGVGKYCSRTCKDVAVDLEDRECPGCGKHFQAAPYSRSRYCERACWYASPEFKEVVSRKRV